MTFLVTADIMHAQPSISLVKNRNDIIRQATFLLDLGEQVFEPFVIIKFIGKLFFSASLGLIK